MFEEAQKVLLAAEVMAERASTTELIHELRKLCLSDFNDLIASLPRDDLPNISKLLPRMASAEVQQSWTGGSGPEMAKASLDFVRILYHQFTSICQRPLVHAKVLDYGCGYGRLIRPMYYFTDPRNIWGLDPWEKSIDICKTDGVLGNLALSDYLPLNLPVGEERFDLIYSFSVFTHTSVKATAHALDALRRCISPGGILVLTTRPAEYWMSPALRQQYGAVVAAQLDQHRETGFAFLPSTWNLPPDGVSIFGDTSFTPDWVLRNFPSWNVQAIDRGLDPMQLILVLTARQVGHKL